MTLKDRLLFMCSDENPNNLLLTFSGGLFSCFILFFMISFFLHSLGVIYCYLIHGKSCDALPYIYSATEYFMFVIITPFIGYILFKGLTVMYNDIKYAFKTNEEIEKLKTNK